MTLLGKSVKSTFGNIDIETRGLLASSCRLSEADWRRALRAADGQIVDTAGRHPVWHKASLHILRPLTATMQLGILDLTTDQVDEHDW